MRPLIVVALILMLTAPVAAAGAAVSAPLDLHDGGTLLASGAAGFAGRLRGAFVAAEAASSRFGPTDAIDVVSGSSGGGGLSGSRETHSEATLVIESGGFVAILERPFALDATAEHALLVAGPPTPSGESTLVALSGGLRGGLTPESGDALTLVPFSARVSLLGADGRALDGWSNRAVNEGLDPTSAADEGATAFVLRGVVASEWRAAVAVLPMGTANDSRQGTLELRPAKGPAVAATMDRLADAAGALGAGFLGDDAERQALAAVAPFVNGALVIVPGPGGASRSVEIDGTEVPHGRALVFRGESLTATWSGPGPGRASGSPDLVFANSAFVTSDVPTVFELVPVLAFALWVGAIAGYVARILKKPPPARLALGRRAIALAIYLGALAVSFVLWDGAFAAATGTSALSTFDGQGIGTSLLVLLGLQSLTWTVAFLAFGLPVAILAATAMRYAGLGKEWNRISRVAGFAAALALGSGMILWILNQTVVKALLNLM